MWHSAWGAWTDMQTSFPLSQAPANNSFSTDAPSSSVIVQGIVWQLKLHHFNNSPKPSSHVTTVTDSPAKSRRYPSSRVIWQRGVGQSASSEASFAGHAMQRKKSRKTSFFSLHSFLCLSLWEYHYHHHPTPTHPTSKRLNRAQLLYLEQEGRCWSFVNKSEASCTGKIAGVDAV